MKTQFGLQRERIRASIYKKPVARSMALIIDVIQKSITSDCDDFWVSVELNVNINNHRVGDKHMAIDTYITIDGQSGIESLPLERIRIPSYLDKRLLVLPWAHLVKALARNIQAEQDDFCVKIDCYIHMVHGTSHEKKVRVNVYGDLVDDYSTTILDVKECLGVPEEVLTTLCNDFDKLNRD